MSDGNYVLVVSDDAHIQDEARFGFGDRFEVAAAGDARSAWHSLMARRPELVMMEIRSGSAGGVGLVRDMSQNAQLQDVPVLMILEREQDVWLARQAGADEIIIQPFDSATLISAALKLIDRD